MKTRTKGKAIIGIAMAAIMIASVMVAMLPMASAADKTRDYTTIRNGFTVNPGFVVIDITTGDKDAIKIGQEIIFSDTKSGDKVLIEGIEDTATDGESFSSSTFKTETDPNGIHFDTKSMTETGSYDVSLKRIVGENDTIIAEQRLSVSTPTIPLDLKVGVDIVSSIAVGTKLRIDCPTDLDPKDCVDLKIVDPKGRTIKTWTVDTTAQKFNDINVDQLSKYGTTGTEVNTKGWKLGTYTFSIVTEEENARGLAMSSTTKSVEVLKGEVDIDVDKTEVGELQPVTVTVTGISEHIVTVEATAGEEYVEFEKGLNDFGATTDRESGDSGVYKFNVKIDADGKRSFSVIFHDTGAYTLRVRDTTPPNVGDTETVDVKVSEKLVTFDMKPTVVIGEDIELKGTANAGDYIDIAIEDYIVKTSIAIAEDGSFEEDLPTPETRGTGTPGSLRVEVFIRTVAEPAPALDKDISGKDDDGSVSILLSTGTLTAEISVPRVAQEDDFQVEGTAEGSDSVDILTIAPKGGGGKGINPDSVSKVPGISQDSSAVSDIDYSFSKKLDVDDDADTGKYTVVVLSPGRDGVYNGIATDKLLDGIATDYYGGDLAALGSKTQEQIMSVLEDATIYAAGSDDLMWVGYIKVESPFVSLDPIASVGIGEPLVVTGTTNREEGFSIVVTCKGPVELKPQTVKVEDGTFNVTFDTTDAEVGTYTVKADDGDGNTDEATVEIGAAVPTPTATPTPTPTATPTAAPVPTAEPTPEPTAEPTPEPPGFEAVFAIAGMLAIAYLVVRRRK